MTRPNAANEVTLDQLRSELNEWIDQSPEDKRRGREEASRRMIECWEQELTVLDLSELDLTSLPTAIGYFTSLTELYIGHNQLTTIPDSIGNLASLTELNIHINQLTTIPDSIGNLALLTKLYIGHNQLTTIPDSIGNLASLTELYLGYNQLTTIPDSIGNLASLTELYLGYNQLTTIPAASLPKNLNFLNLNNCPQLQITPELIARLSDLSNRNCDIRYPEHFNPNNLATIIKEKLNKICAKERKENSPDFISIKNVLHRFLGEGIGQRSNADTPSKRAEEIVLSALPTLEILEKNPHLTPLVDEISSDFTGKGCVNQPVIAWSIISALMTVAAKENFPEKLEAAKQLLVLNYIVGYVTGLPKDQQVGEMFEAEAGNYILSEIHKKLIGEKFLKEAWIGVPNKVANDDGVNGTLKNKISEITKTIKTVLSLELPDAAELILNSQYCQAFATICFFGEVKEISDSCQIGYESAVNKKDYDKIKASEDESIYNLLKDRFSNLLLNKDLGELEMKQAAEQQKEEKEKEENDFNPLDNRNQIPIGVKEVEIGILDQNSQQQDDQESVKSVNSSVNSLEVNHSENPPTTPTNNEPKTSLEVPVTKPSPLRYLRNLLSAAINRGATIHSENPPTTPNSTTQISTVKILQESQTNKPNLDR